MTKSSIILPAPGAPAFICYRHKEFNDDGKAIIVLANRIIARYRKMGYKLTLRQLFYQFVRRNAIRNNDKEYDRLGRIISEGRMAGLIDWNAIEDRTRNLRTYTTFKSPTEAMEAAIKGYARNKWARQPYRPEVWVEKDALLGVIGVACERLQVPYFSCRGYTSQSEEWAAGQRMVRHLRRGQQPIVFHLGDHDPSGVDMTRDNDDRLNDFIQHHVGTQAHVMVQRIALNMDQVREFNPPPNPTKMKDSRSAKYRARYGNDSWELDALSPPTIGRLINAAVLSVRDEELWKQAVEREDSERGELKALAARLKKPKEKKQ